MARLVNGEISSQTKNGQVYYRVSVGRKLVGEKSVIRDGKEVKELVLGPAEFGLGKNIVQARIKRDVLLEVWRQFGAMQPKQFSYVQRDPRNCTTYSAADLANDWVEAKDTYWTPQMLARVEKTMNELQSLHTILSRSANEHLESAARIEAVINKGFVQAEELSAAQPIPVLTLYSVLDDYEKLMLGKPLSDSYKSRISDAVASLKAYREDCEFTKSQIDRQWLEALTDFVKARPLSRRKSKSGKAERIMPHTVKTLLDHWERVFEWVDNQSESDRYGHWEAPKKFQKLFDLNMDQIMSKAERDKAKDGPEQITISQVVQMYCKGIRPENKDHQAWFLTGLFGAQGQTELAVAMGREFDLYSACFTHRRNKTGQLGRYWLPPELVELLRPMLKGKQNSEELVFVTADGTPLVSEKSDAIRQAWEDWEERAELELPKGMGFYSLRRFFSDRALKIGGTDLQTTALSQSGKTIGQKHYSGFRDFDAVGEVGKKLYLELQAAGMFESAKKAKKVQAA